MRRWMLWMGTMATALLVAVFGYGCGETSFGTCLDNGTCPGDGGAPADGTTDVAQVSQTEAGNDAGEPVDDAGPESEGGSDAGEVSDASCNPSSEPMAEPCLVNEAFGVFVSGASGGDTAKGTRADPLRTITEGIAKAVMGPKRVFACAGTYDEHVVVAAAQDGVRIYGGFDCAGWKYAASNVVRVEPSTTGYALKVDSLTAGATFEDMAFGSQNAQLPGDSSVAVFANQSVATFRRVVMTAGNGAPGAQGDAGMNYTAVQAPSGNNADGGIGGARQQCDCLDGDQSTGGAGGNAGPPAVSGLTGLPALGGGQAGAGGTGSCNNLGAGTNGANSTDGDGGTGAATVGDLSVIGWSSASGLRANVAPVAQGGGGGGGNPSVALNDAGLSPTGGGGSGGCGGCGGGGGTPGQGGGSSFALLSYKSTITLVGCQLAAHDGKNGGPGGEGQPGQPGGDQGVQTGKGCPGGNGGNAGNGGGGGGGAGGVSAAIGYVGDAPTEMSTVSKTVGNFGTGGPGGNGGGSGNAGSKGVDGVASAVLAL